jgi:voltage-gated sodium channel
VDLLRRLHHLLNLFIAVVVNNMDRGMSEELVAAEEKHAAEQKASDELLLTEMRALRSEIAKLRAERTSEEMNR